MPAIPIMSRVARLSQLSKAMTAERLAEAFSGSMLMGALAASFWTSSFTALTISQEIDQKMG